MTTVPNRARAMVVGLAAFAATAILAVPAAAMDIETSGFFGNLGLPWTGDTAMTADVYPANLWLYGGRVAFVEQLGEGFSLTAEYETDVVLHNIVRGIVRYESGIASISAGPMVGIFNSLSSPLKTGIDIGFRLEAPGLAFFSATVESSMGAGISSAGDYSQEMTELTVGWYVTNAICSLSMTAKEYARMITAVDHVSDSSTDYRFSVDVYKKGAPYRVLAELGYRDMTRTYPDASIDGLGALVLGARISAEPTTAFSVIAGLDSGVYVFGIENLAGHGPAASSFLFNASLGLIIHLGTEKDADASNAR